jgi:hypothetical protein
LRRSNRSESRTVGLLRGETRQAGSFVFLPRARPHRFRATTDRSARLLLISVRGGIEDYLRQINNASGDEERHRIGELHGIRVVPE